jgi:hypothetical protein
MGFKLFFPHNFYIPFHNSTCPPQKLLVSISAPPTRKCSAFNRSSHPFLTFFFFLSSCVGVWQNDRVEIIANDQGNRTTPSYVSFSDNERLIGDAAKNQVAMNPHNTYVVIRPTLHLKILNFSVVFLMPSA